MIVGNGLGIDEKKVAVPVCTFTFASSLIHCPDTTTSAPLAKEKGNAIPEQDPCRLGKASPRDRDLKN